MDNIIEYNLFGGIDELATINSKVLEVLGKQQDNTLVIRDTRTFEEYVSNAIKSGRIAIDTETNNSLDPVTCKIMGLCLYYPGGKAAYIPINHIDKNNNLLINQLTEQDCKIQLQRLIDAKTFIIMHNGKFDYEVLKCTCGVAVKPDWDTMIAAKLLNENEPCGLKEQYISKIDPSQEAYKIDKLFKDVMYAVVDPDIFALYSATDAMMTYKLYQLQKAELDKPEYDEHFSTITGKKVNGLRWLFHNVEMPIVVVTAEMELAGIQVDCAYAKRLYTKYKSKLDSIDNEIVSELDKLKPLVDDWKKSKQGRSLEIVYAKTSVDTSDDDEDEDEIFPECDYDGRKYRYGKRLSDKLSETINIASPTQLAILIYDVLKCCPISKKKPRDTSRDALDALSEEYPDIKILTLLNKRRTYAKLISTYIETIPKLSSIWPDGRVRCHFNNLGTKTGRFSAGGKIGFIRNGSPVVLSGLNLQNIPSHGANEIRMLFKGSEGKRLVGGDFGSQEPRLAAIVSGDSQMKEAFLNKDDLYAIIAQSVYNNRYEDNLEFVEANGIREKHPEGKKRRSVGKTLLLSTMYGMSPATAGKQIKAKNPDIVNALKDQLGEYPSDKELGNYLMKQFFSKFKILETAIDKAKQNTRDIGYSEDWAGRRRHLPDINLPRYEVSSIPGKRANANDIKFWNETVKKMPKTTYAQLMVTCNKAKRVNVLIESNNHAIQKAERQCFNAAIQGGAATITKIAMIKLFNDSLLKSYGAHLVITVHDEVMMEVPEENAEAAAKRMQEIMKTCVDEYVDIPMEVDTYNVKRWYADEIAEEMKEEYNELLEKCSSEEALNSICSEYPDIDPYSIKQVLEQDLDEIVF